MSSGSPTTDSSSPPTTISNRNRELWSKPQFWQALCPHLHVCQPEINRAPPQKSEVKPLDQQQQLEAERRRTCLAQEGYARVNDPLDATLIQQLLTGIRALHAQNYPASFILLFDETWQLARLSHKVLQQSTHPSHHFQFDILAWFIEQGGFSPHRDRQPDDAAASFHADAIHQQAKFVTHWIALSDATPENSCLYVLPKPHDPGYTNGDTEKEEPLQRALPDKQAFQHIRALPRPSGTSLLFTHRIIHWGSARDPSAPKELPPRVAISFVNCDPTFEKPHLTSAHQCFSETQSPPFRIRLLLVCAQLLIYYQRFNLPKETIQACYQYCKDYQEELEESYRQKVFFEYVQAMKEYQKQHQAENGDYNGANGAKKKDSVPKSDKNDNDDDEEEEEAMLEEMLNAENAGYGEFEDDYDEANEEGEEEDDGGKNGTFFGQEGDDDDNDEDEEEGMSLFGKRQSSDDKEAKPASKRPKP